MQLEEWKEPGSICAKKP